MFDDVGIKQRLTIAKFPLLIISLCLLCTLASTNGQSAALETLRLVQVVLRQGPANYERNANALRTPNNDKIYWPTGLERIHQFVMKEEYELGQLLRARYIAFMGGNFTRNLLYVSSANNEQVIQTAQLVVAGLMPPAGKQVWNPDLPWQPVVINTDDLSLNVDQAAENCELNDLLVANATIIAHNNQSESEKKFLKFLTSKTGQSSFRNMQDALMLVSSMEQQRLSNQPLPGLGETDFETLTTLAVQAKIASFGNPVKARNYAGVLLKEVADRMSQKTSSVAKPSEPNLKDAKIFIYSAGENVLLGLQSLLKTLTSESMLPYASALLFELHEPRSGSFEVQLLLRNDSTSDPKPLNIPGCSSSCSLSMFIDVLRNSFYSEEEWNDNCNHNSLVSTKEKNVLAPQPLAAPVMEPGQSATPTASNYSYKVAVLALGVSTATLLVLFLASFLAFLLRKGRPEAPA